MQKIKVGILGATRMVGQRFVQLLEGHPWFEVSELAASPESAGKAYEEAVAGRWKTSADLPEYARKMKVKECRPNLDCRLVFSALDASVAGPIEEEFAKAGYAVSSNSRNHRMDSDVPLLIPEVNAEHLELVKKQQQQRKWKGFIVTNPNCSTIHMVLALKPLMDRFGLEKVIVTTMQALSGAGYPGVASMDIIDNVYPYIGMEEEKVQTETLKLLGKPSGNSSRIENAKIAVSAQCNRVNVSDGHTECVSVKLSKSATEKDIIRAFENFNPLQQLKLPSSPQHPIVVRTEMDRPQPKLDRNLERGMASVVGRIRKCNVLDYKFVVLGHNTIRGAAGAAILNAELMRVKGLIG
ncbi:aspartate-semialdehyde dehydrogenase [Candidatus Woesearchaeota archaeon]|nr:aspartate-semialdehyde dehydrogenase [Candidatus Woesearchaeota archaeon]